MEKLRLLDLIVVFYYEICQSCNVVICRVNIVRKVCEVNSVLNFKFLKA